MLIGMGIENVANDDVVIVGEEEKSVVIVECAEKWVSCIIVMDRYLITYDWGRLTTVRSLSWSVGLSYATN